MALSIPAFVEDQVYNFNILRMLQGALASPGVVHSGDMAVSPSSGLQVQIAAGHAFVQQTVEPENSFYGGLYYLINDAPANPFNTILAPITNPRIDQAILRIYDVGEQSLGGSSKAQFEWLPGSESASASLATMGPGLSNPGATALPANSMQLAYVLQTVGESSIPAANIVDARPKNRGSSNIAASESRTNTAYGTMPTPDQVTAIVLPANGKIIVGYQATWQESVSGAGSAALFLGGNQIKIASNAGSPLGQAAGLGGTAAQNAPLFTSGAGLVSFAVPGGYTGDVTTGQLVGGVGSSPASSGEADIFAAAGTYTVSVQFKASSGSVTASNRKLWVEVKSYA